MIKKHEELLEQIRLAETQTRKLYAEGCTGLDNAVHALKGIAVQLQERIAEYRRIEARTVAKAPPKPPAPISPRHAPGPKAKPGNDSLGAN